MRFFFLLSLSCVCVCAGTLDDGQQRYSSRRDYMLLLRTGFSSEVAPSTSAFPPGPLATSQALKSPTAAIVYDDSNHDRFPPGDPSRRAFTYFVLTGGRFIYASAIRLAVLKFVLSMSVRISHAHTHTHTCSHHMEPGCLRRGKSDLPPLDVSLPLYWVSDLSSVASAFFMKSWKIADIYMHTSPLIWGLCAFLPCVFASSRTLHIHRNKYRHRRTCLRLRRSRLILEAFRRVTP